MLPLTRTRAPRSACLPEVAVSIPCAPISQPERRVLPRRRHMLGVRLLGPATQATARSVRPVVRRAVARWIASARRLGATRAIGAARSRAERPSPRVGRASLLWVIPARPGVAGRAVLPCPCTTPHRFCYRAIRHPSPALSSCSARACARFCGLYAGLSHHHPSLRTPHSGQGSLRCRSARRACMSRVTVERWTPKGVGGLGLPPAPPLTLAPVVEHLSPPPRRHKGAVTVVMAPASSPPADLIPRHAHFVAHL